MIKNQFRPTLKSVAKNASEILGLETRLVLQLKNPTCAQGLFFRLLPPPHHHQQQQQQQRRTFSINK